jgi:hypothetical protein
MKEEEKIKRGDNKKLKNAVNEINVPYLTTLSDCQEDARKKGFTDEYSITPKGLYASETQKYYQPSDVKIDNFYRFEGVSDPDDNSILYLITLSDGSKGVLVDGYGMYSNEQVGDFLKQVEDIAKKA